MGDSLQAVDLGGRYAVTVDANQYQSCVILDDQSAKCWGNNKRGELGQGDVVRRGSLEGQLGDALPPIDLGTGRTVMRIATSLISSCAVLDGNDIKCWGGNVGGELGQGDTDRRGDEPGEMGDALPTVDLDL